MRQITECALLGRTAVFNVTLFVLGLCLYFCPPLFRRLAAGWYPDEFVGDAKAENERMAGILRSKFWRAVAKIGCTFGVVVLLRWWWLGALGLDAGDWLRMAAAFIALTAALGRGGWQIQTWKSQTVVERIDRGMYVLGQLGAAALLVFILTL
jgi:hypothetical protein